MKIIFNVIDKTGRKIRMTNWNWEHIIRRHPEISSEKDKIIETLEKPDKITLSTRDEDVRYYYKYYKHISHKYKFLRVIVKHLNGEGFVISAQFISKINQSK